jgi:hypothetical protein
MLNWKSWFRPALIKPSTVSIATVERSLPIRACGKYEPLYKYLENRYATIVVLTLSEIEDILGFTLPAAARTDRAWWTLSDPDTPTGAYADAWKSASRTAVPNLVARAVVFERVGSY